MKNHKKNKLLFLIFIFMSSLGMAEKSDRDKPIEIEADTMTVDDTKSISTYTGDVILTQGTLIIHADTLIAREDKQGCTHSTSLGKPATFKQKMEGEDEYIDGEGLRIEYDGHMDKVHLYEKAYVKRGVDEVWGDYIMYDANSEFAQALSGDTKNKNGEVSKKGRTKAIINPKKEN